MRHANPQAVTMLLSSFPEMNAAAQAILMQADEILIKSADLTALVEAIKKRIGSGPGDARVVESVAAILERAGEHTIEDWFELVQCEHSLMRVPLSQELRCKHLPQIFHDLVHRLRSPRPLGDKGLASIAAIRHGTDRQKQGYTAAMMVPESRIVQVCIFNRLQNNLASIDFSVLLMEVMTIADEVDSQLAPVDGELRVAASLDHSLSSTPPSPLKCFVKCDPCGVPLHWWLLGGEDEGLRKPTGAPEPQLPCRQAEERKVGGGFLALTSTFALLLPPRRAEETQPASCSTPR